MWAHGQFHWNELMTRDVGAAKSFYEKSIGWQFSDMPMPAGGIYYVAMAGDRPVAGMMDINGSEFTGVPDGWFPYLAVDDVDARVALAQKAGATVVRPPWTVPGVGRIAILMQPDGAAVGWMTPQE